MKTLVLAAAGTLAVSPAFAFSPLESANFEDLASLVGLSTTWTNEKGSTMTITVSSDGTVTGHYINRAAGTGCQNSAYQIAGRVNGDFIGFSVGWINGTENCNSVTSWAGYAFQKNQPNAPIELITQWNLAFQSGSGSQFMQGSDTFTLQRARESSFLQ